jgi:Raf kinase inhibitor-like YbhB/YbcL family protein
MDMNSWTLATAAAAALVVGGCRDASVSPGPPAGKTAAAIVVSSASFPTGASIPPQYTCDGGDQSPQLSWTSVPEGTKSIAIIVDDPDAPHGTFTHWTLWNVAATARTIGANGNGGFAGGISGTNDFDRVGYSGPCPPKGQLHHYHFTVYALDTTLKLRASDKRADVNQALHGHVLAQGTLVGTFQH